MVPHGRSGSPWLKGPPSQVRQGGEGDEHLTIVVARALWTRGRVGPAGPIRPTQPLRAPHQSTFSIRAARSGMRRIRYDALLHLRFQTSSSGFESLTSLSTVTGSSQR